GRRRAANRQARGASALLQALQEVAQALLEIAGFATRRQQRTWLYADRRGGSTAGHLRRDLGAARLHDEVRVHAAIREPVAPGDADLHGLARVPEVVGGDDTVPDRVAPGDRVEVERRGEERGRQIHVQERDDGAPDPHHRAEQLQRLGADDLARPDPEVARAGQGRPERGRARRRLPGQVERTRSSVSVRRRGSGQAARTWVAVSGLKSASPVTRGDPSVPDTVRVPWREPPSSGGAPLANPPRPARWRPVNAMRALTGASSGG